MVTQYKTLPLVILLLTTLIGCQTTQDRALGGGAIGALAGGGIAGLAGGGVGGSLAGAAVGGAAGALIGIASAPKARSTCPHGFYKAKNGRYYCLQPVN